MEGVRREVLGGTCYVSESKGEARINRLVVLLGSDCANRGWVLEFGNLNIPGRVVYNKGGWMAEENQVSVCSIR